MTLWRAIWGSWIFRLSVVYLAGWLVLAVGPFAINRSPSVPVGLWLESEDAPRVGDVVEWCPGNHPYPDSRGSCPDGRTPLAKVLCHGQTLVAVDGTLVLDGEFVATIDPLWFGLVAARRGDAWLLSSHPRGYDSRWVGSIPAGEIGCPLRPVLVRHDPEHSRLIEMCRQTLAPSFVLVEHEE